MNNMFHKRIGLPVVIGTLLIVLITQTAEAAEQNSRNLARKAALANRLQLREARKEQRIQVANTRTPRPSVARRSTRSNRAQALLVRRNTRIAQRTNSINWQLPNRKIAQPIITTPSANPKSEVAILLDSINIKRVKADLQPLQENHILTRAARARIKLSKEDRNKTEVSSLLESEGYMNIDMHACNCSAWQYTAMEIAASQGSLEGMLATIFEDEKNHTRLLSDSFKDIGIAVEDKKLLIILGAITFTPIQEFTSAQQVEYKKEVLELVNIERLQYGLQPVVQNDLLEKAAQMHAEDMWNQKYFSHTSLDGRVVEQRAFDAGYTNLTAENCNCSAWSYRLGENIASGQKDPESVMDSWMESIGHRKNILTPEFNELGVGIIGNKWVQDFGAIIKE